MIATISSASLLGVDGSAVSVEVHVSNGLPGLTIVGLPDAACREARDRVRAAMVSSKLKWPQRRVTVNLAPSGLRKVGAGLDVAIAVGIHVANGELPGAAVAGIGFIGELGLDGALRAIDGIVPLVDALDDSVVIVPPDSVEQAALVGRHEVRTAHTLGELFDALRGRRPWVLPGKSPALRPARAHPDMSDVRGQPLGRWAVEVAAAGGHNLLMTGPPGSGKTMLARRLPGLLPALDPQTALECTKVHSAAGLLEPGAGLVTIPPFRAPHHTSSLVSLTGGGTVAMRPGEVSLAHGGVLFCDEMAEFPRSVLDALRQPLEEGTIRVSRAVATVKYPARFLFVGATNPCPCGEGVRPGACRCSLSVKTRYASRISGPLRDRFDLRVIVHRPRVDHFFDQQEAESSANIRARVVEARLRALGRSGKLNSLLSGHELDAVAPLSSSASRLLRNKMARQVLTARGFVRVRRVALTLADLAGEAVVDDEHVCAALELRPDAHDHEEVA